MAQVRLRELYFIEDPKNRRAFLQALKEVEEEGFEIEDASLLLGKFKNIEKTTAEKRKAANTARVLAGDGVGKTPADMQKLNRLTGKRKFTNTNAVDLKDYKYWRDEYLEKPKTESKDTEEFSLDNFDFSRPTRRNRSASQGASLYDELFGDVTKPHDKEKTKVDNRSNLYKTIDSLFDDEEEPVKEQKPKTALQKLSESYLASDEHKKQVKDNLDAYYKRKEEKAKKELEDAKAEAEKAKKETAETKKENQKLKEEAEKAKKLTVEVIAPEPAPKKPRKKSTTISTKKRKKKLDADIKLYKNIKFD